MVCFIEKLECFTCVLILHCSTSTIMYCATSMFKDMRNTLPKMSLFVRPKSPILTKISFKFLFSSEVRPKLSISVFFIENAKFCPFFIKNELVLSVAINIPTDLHIRWNRLQSLLNNATSIHMQRQCQHVTADALG